MGYDLSWLGLTSSLVVLGGVTFPLVVHQNGLLCACLSTLILAYISNDASKAYIQRMGDKTWTLETVIQKRMGKRWRTAFVATKVMHFTQIILIYLLNLNQLFQNLVNLPFQNTDITISSYVTFPFLLPLIIALFLKYQSNLQLKYSWISGLALFGVLVILIVSSFRFGISSGNVKELFTKNNLGSIPMLFAYNNLSFEFQIYLPLLLNPQNQKSSHYDICKKVVIISLVYLCTCGFFGSLYIEAYYSLNDSLPSSLQQSGLLVDFQYLSSCYIINICLVYHLLANLSFKAPQLGASLLELLNDKPVNDKYLNPEEQSEKNQRIKKLEIYLTLSVLFLLTLLVLATPNQQEYITTLTGSFSAFMLIYRIPYGLKYSKIKKSKLKHQSLIHIFGYKKEIIAPLLKFEIEGHDTKVQQSQKHQNKWTQLKDYFILMLGYAVLIYGLYFFIDSNIS